MARCGHSGAWGGWVVGLVAIITLAFVTPSLATLKYGPVQLAGSVSSQNLVRHHDFADNYQFIQNRNTATLRFEWDWVQKGKLIDRIDVPFIKRSNIFIFYRGVYDGYYDIAPGGLTRGVSRADDFVGGPIEGNDIGDIFRDDDGFPLIPEGSNNALLPGQYSRVTEGARERSKFENELREAYLDFKLTDLPLSFRMGRQQVIWGESDQFRLMDIWNPLDLTWHLQQEDFVDLRVPLWMIKGIYDIGRVGPLSNTFIEAVWNPGDFQPGVKLEFLPYPWSVPVPNPVREGQIQQASPTSPIFLAPTFDLQGTGFKRGDFQRNPEEASDVGLRFHGVTPQGFEFTTNYLYIRGRGIGAKAGTPFSLEIDSIEVPTTGNPNNRIRDASGQPAVFGGGIGSQATGVHGAFPAFVKAHFNHPYSHIFGLTGNYFEGNYTNTVFRMETAYALDQPFQTRDDRVRVTELFPTADGGTRPCNPDAGESCLESIAPIAATERDVWAGMIGFDRPTWIRWLNRKTTWFLTGQLFWSYVNGKAAGLRGGVLSASEQPYFIPGDVNKNGRLGKFNDEGEFEFEPILNDSGQPTGLTEGCRSCDSALSDPQLGGQGGLATWTTGPYAGQVERTQDASINSDLADNFRRWEMLMTFAGLSFYKGGTIVPFFAVAIDPVNVNWLIQLKCDFFVTNNFIIQPNAKLFGSEFFGQTSGERQVLDPWGVGGLNHRRDEIGLKVTYQF